MRGPYRTFAPAANCPRHPPKTLYFAYTLFKENAEQASIPRFIEKVFGAPALSTLDSAAQDGQANDLFGAFDFTQTPLDPLVLTERVCK